MTPEERREKKKEYDREYRKNNKEKVKKIQKKYYENNKEKVKEYYQNPDKKQRQKEINKKWHEDNKEKIKEKKINYKKNIIRVKGQVVNLNLIKNLDEHLEALEKINTENEQE